MGLTLGLLSNFLVPLFLFITGKLKALKELLTITFVQDWIEKSKILYKLSFNH
jgi:hypothetical protein